MALTGKMVQRDRWQYRAEPFPALTSKITQGCGWQHQAKNLASTHAAIGMAAMAVAGQARMQPPFEHRLEPRIFEPTNEPEPTAATLAEPKQEVVREAAAAQDEYTEKPAAESAAEAVAEPERTRNLALFFSQIERRLKLLVSENCRLSRCLMERGLADQRVAELERTRNINLSTARKELDLRARMLRCLADRDLANKRVAELERELGLARKEPVLRENENRSRQTSRSAADKACCQTEQMIKDQTGQQLPSVPEQYYTEENAWLLEQQQRQMDMQQYGRSER